MAGTEWGPIMTVTTTTSSLLGTEEAKQVMSFLHDLVLKTSNMLTLVPSSPSSLMILIPFSG